MAESSEYFNSSLDVKQDGSWENEFPGINLFEEALEPRKILMRTVKRSLRSPSRVYRTPAKPNWTPEGISRDGEQKLRYAAD